MGIFSESAASLKDTAIFNSVHVSFDTLEWSNGADLCPEVLYSDSKTIEGCELLKLEETASGHAGSTAGTKLSS